MIFFKYKAARLAALLIALSATPALADSQGQHGHATGDSSRAHQSMQDAMSSGMNKMMSMKSTGDVDRDFATMMKGHHEMAIDMAKTEMDKGKSPELKGMAEQIIKDSRRDIQKIDRWLGQKKQ